MLFLIEKWQLQCRKKLFISSKTLLRENSLLIIRELKMIMKRRPNKSKSSLKKEKMKKKEQSFFKCRKLKKLRV
jgi:hypothetical protein